MLMGAAGGLAVGAIAGAVIAHDLSKPTPPPPQPQPPNRTTPPN
jgi:hypothetical protein